MSKDGGNDWDKGPKEYEPTIGVTKIGVCYKKNLSTRDRSYLFGGQSSHKPLW